MQCSNCRNVEQGRWLYANDPPNPNLILDDDLIAKEYDGEEEEQEQERLKLNFDTFQSF